MGGNVKFGRYEAKRIDVGTFEKFMAVNHRVSRFLEEVGIGAEHYHPTGSYRALLQNYSRVHFVKPTLGDIDVAVLEDSAPAIEANLSRMEFESRIRGFKRSGDTIIVLTNDLMQIDLELVDGSDWSFWIRYSSVDDLDCGIKGFANKYFLRALTSLTVKVFPDVGEMNEYAFSLNGLRRKVKSTYGKYEVVKSKDAYAHDYLTDPKTILHVLLSDKLFQPVGDVLPDNCEELCGSYIRLVAFTLNWIRKKSDVIKIENALLDLLFGENAQTLYRDDPERDKQDKEAVWKEFQRTKMMCFASVAYED